MTCHSMNLKTTEKEKSIFDKSCEIDDYTPKKRCNRLNLKNKGNDKDDDSDVRDPLSKIVGILSEDAKKPHHDICMHIIEMQAQQKIKQGKTKQIEMSLQIMKMELEMAILQQQNDVMIFTLLNDCFRVLNIKICK